MILGVLFDCDGVLADSEPLNHRCWSDAFEALLGAPLRGHPSEIVGLDLARIYALGCRYAGRSSLDEDARRALLAMKSALFLERAPSSLRAAPGARALVSEVSARGIPRAVVSSALRARLLRTLEIIECSEGWSAVLSGEDVIEGEIPQKDWARAALEMGVSLGQCAVFEDSVEGVASARAQGAGHVVAVASGLSLDQLVAAGAHTVVRSLRERSLDALVNGGDPCASR